MRPDVTKAQKIAGALAGVPVLCTLLAAFGVWHPSKAEQDALDHAVAWATGFAALLVAGDAHLRASRNKADAARSHAARTDTAAQTISDAANRMRVMGDRIDQGVDFKSAEPGRAAAPTAHEFAAAGAPSALASAMASSLRAPDDDGPGDPDALPQYGVADPERITPDEGDAGPEVTP